MVVLYREGAREEWQLQTFHAPVPWIYRPSWRAKDLLILEQTVNYMFVLALGNSSWRFAFR